MTLDAGRLRHRVDIQDQLRTQDSNGDIEVTWEDVWMSVPAAIEPLSARDLIAAKAADSEVSVRITIRYRAGLKHSMRLVHNGTIYKPEGWLPDKDSGREYVTAPCSAMANEPQA